MKISNISVDDTVTQPDIPNIIFNSINIIDRAQHWSELLLKESFAIKNQIPRLNHG